MITCWRQANLRPGPCKTTDEVTERQELKDWVEQASSGRTVAGLPRAGSGQLVCRLPFNLAVQDRFGRDEVLLVRSRTIDDQAAVIFSRRKMPLFDVVRIQLDDGTNRAWVRAKVTQNVSTIGGQLVRMEYVAQAASVL